MPDVSAWRYRLVWQLFQSQIQSLLVGQSSEPKNRRPASTTCRCSAHSIMVGRAFLDKWCTMSTDGHCCTNVYVKKFSVGRRKVAVPPLRLFAKNIWPDNGRFFRWSFSSKVPPSIYPGVPRLTSDTYVYIKGLFPQSAPRLDVKSFIYSYLLYWIHQSPVQGCARPQLFFPFRR